MNWPAGESFEIAIILLLKSALFSDTFNRTKHKYNAFKSEYSSALEDHY